MSNASPRLRCLAAFDSLNSGGAFVKVGGSFVSVGGGFLSVGGGFFDGGGALVILSGPVGGL